MAAISAFSSASFSSFASIRVGAAALSRFSSALTIFPARL